MEQKDALLDSLAELRSAHDKASRIMDEIAARGAQALKGRSALPSLGQLRLYEEAAARAQRQAVRCQDLLMDGAGSIGEPGSGWTYIH